MLLPKVLSENHMIFTEFRGNMVRGRFACESTSEIGVKPDVVLMPVVAYDKYGNRLGYGCGHYDRALRDIHAPKIGLAFSKQRYEGGLPNESHDVRLDMIITELGIEEGHL